MAARDFWDALRVFVIVWLVILTAAGILYLLGSAIGNAVKDCDRYLRSTYLENRAPRHCYETTDEQNEEGGQ